MDPKVYGKLLKTHRRGLGDYVEALHDRFPSDRVPAMAPRWDLMDTESCDGGIRFLAPVLFVWGYMELRGAHEAGGMPPPS